MIELAPHMSCVASEQEFAEAIKTYPDVYVVNGLGKILRHIRLKGDRYVRVEVNSIPGLDKSEIKAAVEEEIKFLPNGKIPKVLLHEIVQFFKEVMTIKKADQEAMAHVLWNEKDKDEEHRGYRIAIPNQTVSKASVRYEHDHIEKNDLIVLDIHSHNTMGAFFSGTDDNDDKKGIFFSGVVGDLDKRNPGFIWRLNVNEVKKSAEVTDIFDIEKVEVKVPSAWLDKVKVQEYTQWSSHSQPSGGHYSGKHTPPTGGTTGSAVGNGGTRTHNGEWSHGVSELYEDDTDTIQYGFPHLYKSMNNEAGDTDTPANDNDKKTEKKTGSLIIVPSGTYSKEERKRIEDSGVAVEELSNSVAPQHEGEKDANAIMYGLKAAEAYEQIRAYLEDLESVDELLLNIMSITYGLLSTDGKSKMATKGF
jgi:PRTRC genetic system protein A